MFYLLGGLFVHITSRMIVFVVHSTEKNKRANGQNRLDLNSCARKTDRQHRWRISEQYWHVYETEP